MPKIDFTFQGSIKGAHVSTALDDEGDAVDVSGMSAEELCSKLEAGELFLSFVDALLDGGGEEEIELSEFDAG